MKILGFNIGISRAKDAVATPAVRQSIRRGVPIQRRRFDAAVQDRLTASWTVADQTLNMALRNDLRSMRARSRDFFRNNEYGRKFANMVKNNVVGATGFALKVDARGTNGKVDEQDSARVAASYRRFGKAGNFDVTGRFAETEFDALAITMVARDGEVLIRLVDGMGPHGGQLQLLSGHLLDEDLNRDLASGHRIRMGVEFDQWMKPVAYWLRKQSAQADLHGSFEQNYIKVPAAEIIHLFIAEEIDQWRGIPWPYAALRRARQLDQFEEAALVAANVGAAKMGFFQQKDPEAGMPMGVDETDDIDGEAGTSGPRDFTSSAEPGAFDVIPDNYELKEWDPNYPNDVFGPFVAAVKQAMATGCLVSYHGLTGDLTQVNFSSIRAGTLDEREMWKGIQGWYIRTVKEPVFAWWLARALVFDPEMRVLPYSKFDKFNSPVFFGRRWDWVDPRAESAADQAAVALGTKSRSGIIRDRGADPDVVFQELEAENATGLFSKAAAPAQPQADQPDAGAADDQSDDDKA